MTGPTDSNGIVVCPNDTVTDGDRYGIVIRVVDMTTILVRWSGDAHDSSVHPSEIERVL